MTLLDGYLRNHQGENAIRLTPIFYSGIQSIDPFQGFYIADLPKISLGRFDIYIMNLLLFVGE